MKQQSLLDAESHHHVLHLKKGPAKDLEGLQCQYCNSQTNLLSD